MVEELRQVASMCSSADVERQQAERGCGVWTATTIAAPQLPTSTSKFTRPSHPTPYTSLPATAKGEDQGRQPVEKQRRSHIRRKRPLLQARRPRRALQPAGSARRCLQRFPVLHYGTTSKRTIIAWSSCTRLWQCIMYFPVKSRNRMKTRISSF